MLEFIFEVPSILSVKIIGTSVIQKCHERGEALAQIGAYNQYEYYARDGTLTSVLLNIPLEDLDRYHEGNPGS